MIRLTINDLEQYRCLDKDISTLKREIYEMEHNFLPNHKDESGVRPTEPGDPTANWAMKHIDLLNQLNDKLNSRVEQCITIERYIDQVNDPQIKAIIRDRYILGESWQAVARKVMGSTSESTPRMALKRYLR